MFAAQGSPVGDAGLNLRIILEDRSEAGDQSGSAPECQIGPEPLCRDKYRRPHANQEVDMRETPEPPGESARQPDTAKIGDRRMAADGSEITLVPVAEWCRLVLAKRGSPNHTCDVVPALLGGWRKTWHREVVLPRDSCSIADDKDFR